MKLNNLHFKNINHKEYNVINLSTIQKIVEKRGLTEIGIIEFRESGVIKDKKLIKILANGDLKVKVNVEAHAFSKAAEDAIRAMGGSISII